MIKIGTIKEDIKKHWLYNLQLHEAGFLPNSIKLTGAAGIGKTSVVLQVVEELSKETSKDIKWIKLNLANISDSSDLIGFPKIKTKLERNGEYKYVWETEIKNYPDWLSTGVTVTDYAPPKWVEHLSDGGILLLDDLNRSEPRILQAVMDLIQMREFYSWKLPHNVMIIITGNPDGYNVFQEDSAQKTRYIEYNVEFDFESWKTWAIEKKIKDEFIDFIKLYKDSLFTDDATSSNIRQWTRLFSLLSIADTSESFQVSFAEACVGKDNTAILLEFLKKLTDIDITAEDIIEYTDLKALKKKLNGILYQGDYYKNSFAIIIADKMIKHIIAIKKEDTKMVSNVQRVFDSKIFNEETVNYILTGILSTQNPNINLIMQDLLPIT